MAEQNFTATLIGGPTILLEFGGLRFLTDPTFDKPGIYPSGAITLVKQSGPALEPDAVGPIDVVLLSHDQHWDNLDHAGRAFLPKAGRVLTTKIGAERIGGTVEGLAPWEHVDVPTPMGSRVRVTATPARHGPIGIEPVSGDVIGFVLTLAPGELNVYVSGDTVWYEGVAEVARRFCARLVILFTGSAKPRGSFHMTMDANDAVNAAHAFGNATIVAIHNEGWGHFTETQEELANAFNTLGLGHRLKLLERGVPTLVSLLEK